MFVEIAALVKDQGEMIDNIESHVQKAEIDVEQGKGHLDKAKEYMASARKKKIILFIEASYLASKDALLYPSQMHIRLSRIKLEPRTENAGVSAS